MQWPPGIWYLLVGAIASWGLRESNSFGLCQIEMRRVRRWLQPDRNGESSGPRPKPTIAIDRVGEVGREDTAVRVEAKRISIFNHKGGVGKTTLTLNLAATLATLGSRVLLVDADPQCNLTSYLVSDEVVDDLLDKSDSDTGQTIWSALKPVHEALGPYETRQPIEAGIENLYLIPDLAGLRVLHLHPRQIREIDQHIRSLLVEEELGLCKEPFARTWDDEYRKFFRECGFQTQASPSLYTSVHYVVESSSRKTTTCEIQVRTLMEEVWGEVEHSINYPHAVDSLACREQLKVLARVTSSATRLVDSIF